MIYIFKGCTECCKLPCTLCDGCCKACGFGCESIQKACQECCQAWSDLWEPILKNPLGSYVIFSWIMSAFTICAAVWGVGVTKCDDNALKSETYGYFAAAVIAALVHGFMAWYMQRTIVAGLQGKDYTTMTHKEITAQAGEIILYDVPFCFYSFFGFAVFGAHCWALTLDNCSESNSSTWGAAFLGITYGVLGFCYLFCWYCTSCCAGGAQELKSKAKGKDKGATTVGAPASTA